MGAARFIVAGMLTVASQTGGANPEQQPSVRSQTNLVAPGKDLYGQIFQRRLNLPVTALPNPVTTENPKPRVVCGMVVVPVKPDLDRKILVHPKDNRQPAPIYEYKIRKIFANICTE